MSSEAPQINHFTSQHVDRCWFERLEFCPTLTKLRATQLKATNSIHRPATITDLTHTTPSSPRSGGDMNKFEIIGKIGEGAYGVVLKCKVRSRLRVATARRRARLSYIHHQHHTPPTPRRTRTLISAIPRRVCHPCAPFVAVVLNNNNNVVRSHSRL
jgi:hypothetical protein